MIPLQLPEAFNVFDQNLVLIDSFASVPITKDVRSKSPRPYYSLFLITYQQFLVVLRKNLLMTSYYIY